MQDSNDAGAGDEIHSRGNSGALERIDQPLPAFVNVQNTAPRDLELIEAGLGALLMRRVRVGSQTNQRFGHRPGSLRVEVAVQPFRDRGVGQRLWIGLSQTKECSGELDLCASGKKTGIQKTPETSGKVITLAAIQSDSRVWRNPSVHRNSELTQHAHARAVAVKSVRTNVEAESLALMRDGASAEHLALFEQSDVGAAARQSKGGGKSAQPSSHHNDVSGHDAGFYRCPVVQLSSCPAYKREDQARTFLEGCFDLSTTTTGQLDNSV